MCDWKNDINEVFWQFYGILCQVESWLGELCKEFCNTVCNNVMKCYVIYLAMFL